MNRAAKWKCACGAGFLTEALLRLHRTGPRRCMA